ncbi:hypothetical protein [uncultured Jatrophihabitans sp.]|uniref:hypothetical protein n=1 Tax=uncultured Jatrophihabitans sp. TaxID=1610747 RepID=UPI0035CA7251
MEIPVACSLDGAAARTQLDEWQRLLVAAAEGVERVDETELSIRLADDPALLARTVRLAQREKACCPFFNFALTIEPDAVALRIRVPDDAAQLLDAFERAATDHV